MDTAVGTIVDGMKDGDLRLPDGKVFSMRERYRRELRARYGCRASIPPRAGEASRLSSSFYSNRSD